MKKVAGTQLASSVRMRNITLALAFVLTSFVACGGAKPNPNTAPPNELPQPEPTTGGSESAQITHTTSAAETTYTPPPPTRIPAPAADRSNPTNDTHDAVQRHPVMRPQSLPPPQMERSLPDAMDQGNSDDERKITATIRKELVADSDLSFSAKNVTIITMGGKVVLRGTVSTVAEKNAIDRYARSTPGVTEVNNQLDVKR